MTSWSVNQGVTLLTVACTLSNPPLKGDRIGNPITPSSAAISPPIILRLPQSSSFAMAALHPHLFQPSVADENGIRKLIASHFLPDREVLQWHPATGEDIPTPNTNEIVVFASFFQRGFGLPVCDFLRDLLDHYQIELVHLNPNSILQIIIFVHLCEAYLGIPPNFPLFKNYFFLKYESSAANQKVIGDVGLQTHPRASFLDPPRTQPPFLHRPTPRVPRNLE
jgi:hypothetical protein